ncbi:NAD-binding protein [Priestia aryabhattai]|uniref:NAD-binding protein n=1 Tax=Priestia aryabhattai TaxID=412384 RepID=A0ABD7X111_PRIAR|nr:NAD-binding protein [Priestia aryabhattai]MBY0030859.1 NAD-binding protein [Priestia aryabhattai]WEA46129.1 NAD-binding protein [Priestia aryabhattai]
MEDNNTYRGNQHLIIIGWNERVKDLLSYFDEPLSQNEMVLIDNTLEEASALPHSIHFIKGDPTDPQTFLKANIQHATGILITAELNKEEEEADINSILSLVASKGTNPFIHSVVEILTSKHVINARHAGADQIIQRSLPISRIMYDKFFEKNSSIR